MFLEDANVLQNRPNWSVSSINVEHALSASLSRYTIIHDRVDCGVIILKQSALKIKQLE